MNEEIKRQWVAALRSGEFTQISGQLRRSKPDYEDPASAYGKVGHCCLGVLCELHARSGAGAVDSGWEGDGYDKAGAVLPYSVSAWAGLNEERYGSTYNPTIPGMGVSLAHMNDMGRTFEEIAKMIEENL